MNLLKDKQRKLILVLFFLCLVPGYGYQASETKTSAEQVVNTSAAYGNLYPAENISDDLWIIKNGDLTNGYREYSENGSVLYRQYFEEGKVSRLRIYDSGVMTRQLVYDINDETVVREYLYNNSGFKTDYRKYVSEVARYDAKYFESGTIYTEAYLNSSQVVYKYNEYNEAQDLVQSLEYSSTGVLKLKILYNNGVPTSEFEYASDGKSIIKDIEYRNGIRYRGIEYTESGRYLASLEYYTREGSVNILKKRTQVRTDGTNYRVTEYDTTGNLAQDVIYKTDGLSVLKKYVYTKGVLTERYFYEEENDNLISQTFYNTSGILTSMTSYTNGVRSVYKLYDANGKVSRDTRYLADGKNYANITYYKNSKKTEYRMYDKTYNYLSKRYKYYTNGNVSSRTDYYDNGKAKQVTEYNTSQDLTANTTYFSNGRYNKMTKYKNKRKYDYRTYNSSTGKISSRHIYFTNGKVDRRFKYTSSGKYSSKTEYFSNGEIKANSTYYSNGKIKSKTQYKHKKKVSVSHYKTNGSYLKYYYLPSGKLVKKEYFNIHGTKYKVYSYVKTKKIRGYKLHKIGVCNTSTTKLKKKVRVDIGVDTSYARRDYYAYTNRYGQLFKVTAAQIIPQNEEREHVVHGSNGKTSELRYCKGQASIPNTQKSTYDRGHVIADSLGGAANAYNVTPQAKYLNRYGAQIKMEDRFREAFKDNLTVTDFEMKIYYRNKKTNIPYKYKVTYRINGKKYTHAAYNK